MSERVPLTDATGDSFDALIASALQPRVGVVVLHEIFGPTVHFERLVDRLAQEGCAAVVPDLFGGSPKVAAALAQNDVGAAVRAAFDQGPDRWFARVRAAIDELRLRYGELPLVTVGFCFGGYLALCTSVANGEFVWDGAIAFYGPPEGYGHFGAPSEPEALSRADSVYCPLLLVYGSDDVHVNVASVQAFADAGTAAGADLTLHWKVAQHSFFNETSARYDADAATSAWRDVLEFLARWGGSPADEQLSEGRQR